MKTGGSNIRNAGVACSPCMQLPLAVVGNWRSYSEEMYEMYVNDEQGAPPMLQDCIIIPALFSSGIHLEIHWTRLEGMGSLAVLWKRNEGQKEQKKKNIRGRIFFFFKLSSFFIADMLST